MRNIDSVWRSWIEQNTNLNYVFSSIATVHSQRVFPVEIFVMSHPSKNAKPFPFSSEWYMELLSFPFPSQSCPCFAADRFDMDGKWNDNGPNLNTPSPLWPPQHGYFCEFRAKDLKTHY